MKLFFYSKKFKIVTHEIVFSTARKLNPLRKKMFFYGRKVKSVAQEIIFLHHLTYIRCERNSPPYRRMSFLGRIPFETLRCRSYFQMYACHPPLAQFFSRSDPVRLPSPAHLIFRTQEIAPTFFLLLTAFRS